MRKLGNPIGYIPYNRMSEVVTSHKDKNICVKCGIYQIECECGSIYVGETGRELNVRISEHKRSCNNGPNQDGFFSSGVSEHIWTEDGVHSIRWNEADVILQEPRFFQRKIKEAVIIKKKTALGIPLMNRRNERGCEWLHAYWDKLLIDIILRISQLCLSVRPSVTLDV